MRIFSLYQDFFLFLENILPNSEKWRVYSDYYYNPHQEFFEVYFSHFPTLDSPALKKRVETIKVADYSWLKALISRCPPENIIEEAYERCRLIAPSPDEPDVYLIVGFFSPDGFIMDLRGKPVICFGLERFRDFRLLKILFAHEHAHYLLNLSRGEAPEEKELKWVLVSEGISTYFSYSAFPEQHASDHFLFSRDRLNWCQDNEDYLRALYNSGQYSKRKLLNLYDRGDPDLDIPPRAGKYLGFKAVEKFLDKNKGKGITELLIDKDLALSLEL